MCPNMTERDNYYKDCIEPYLVDVERSIGDFRTESTIDEIDMQRQ